MKPPSNAREIHLRYTCDSCGVHSSVVHAFYNPNPDVKVRVTQGKVNRQDMQVCTGCFFAYRHTMQAHGWAYQKTRKWYDTNEIENTEFTI